MLKRDGGHVLRKELDFEVDGQRKKGRLRGHGRSRLRKKVEGWFEHGRCALPIKLDCWC